jgi:DNA ligase-4
VTVEEIDRILHAVAAKIRFSSPAVRASAPTATSSSSANRGEEDLYDLWTRMTARDAKWLTRLVLKNYQPVLLDVHTAISSCHPLLPTIMKVQDDLVVACNFLERYQSNHGDRRHSRLDLARELKPALGVKIGRPTWLKGRSIKHCLNMGHGRMSCEEKMDGEYCQIHIDLSKGEQCIQIFSKSGKDSTQDRVQLHDAIRKSLQLGQPSCPIKTGCILEGELVVYSDREGKVLDFHKIRKYVSRSGRFLDTEQDSQPHPWDHLMIVYYDLLLVDGESLLGAPQSTRFQRMRQIITCSEGRAALVKREIIDFGKKSAATDLCHAFSRCIAARKEGLVLKPDDPYFNFNSATRPYMSCVIKVKKEYFDGYGDVGDFAVVGTRYDAAKAKTYGIPNLKWTHFYIGCLLNREEVLRWAAIPRFKVTNVVELNATQLRAFNKSVCPMSTPTADNEATVLDFAPGIDAGKRPSLTFPDPPVFDVRCFSFDKEGNTGFWTPRFPQVSKIQFERGVSDVLSFDDLQRLALLEKEEPVPEDSQEVQDLMADLGNGAGGLAIGEGESFTQTTMVSTPCMVMTRSTQQTWADGELSQQVISVAGSDSQASGLLGRRETADEVTANEMTGEMALPVPVSDVIQPAVGDETSDANGPDSRSRSSQNDNETGRLKRRGTTFSQSPRSPKAQKQSSSHRDASSPRHYSQPDPSPIKTATPRAPLSNLATGSSRRNGSGVASPFSSASFSSASFSSSSFSSSQNNNDTINANSNNNNNTLRRLRGVSSMHVLSAETENQEPSTTTMVSVHIHPSASFPNLSQAGTNFMSPPPLGASLPHAKCLTSCAMLSSGTQASSQMQMEPGTATCTHCPNTCQLATYSFLLAPCVAGMPWLTEDLLANHGIVKFAVDPTLWTDEFYMSPSPMAPDMVSTPVDERTAERRKQRKKRKIVLVERHRKEATDTLLARIETAALKRRSGEREWVSVYDWRVLEELTAAEKSAKAGRGAQRRDPRFDLMSGQSLWRKHWVGLA